MTTETRGDWETSVRAWSPSEEGLGLQRDDAHLLVELPACHRPQRAHVGGKTTAPKTPTS